jgi:hypothetical protein
VLVLLMVVIYKFWLEMASCGMIYIQSVMKIGTGVPAILSFCLRNFGGCKVGNTDG